MDLKQLEYFVRVVELGSFTRASIALDIAQPALSRQVRLLEVELRHNLLVRNGRGVTPTAAGKLLLEHGRGILHQVQRAREELARMRGAHEERVAIGLPPSVAKVLAVPFTRAFRARFPDASLSLTEGLSAAMREALVNGRLDVALLYNPVPEPDIELARVVEEDLFLVQRAGGANDQAGPIALEDVARQPLVIPSRPNALRVLLETELAGIGCQPRIALEIDGVGAILDLVADGAGSAVLSRNAVATAPRPERYITRRIVQPELRSRLVLAVSARRPVTPTQEASVALLKTMAGEVLG